MERTNQPLTNEAARKLMALDVQDKEILTYEKLDEWYTAWGGQCYVSFSGGKDSTVLAHRSGRSYASTRSAICKAYRNGGRFGCYEVVRLEEGEA